MHCFKDDHLWHLSGLADCGLLPELAGVSDVTFLRLELADTCAILKKLSASPYKSQRILLRGSIRSELIANPDAESTPDYRKKPAYAKTQSHAGLCIAIQGQDEPELSDGLWVNRSLNLIHQQKKCVNGFTDWTMQDLVFDVPNEAVFINFGMYLDGRGSSWMSPLSLTVVDKACPITKNPWHTNSDFIEARGVFGSWDNS